LGALVGIGLLTENFISSSLAKELVELFKRHCTILAKSSSSRLMNAGIFAGKVRRGRKCTDLRNCALLLFLSSRFSRFSGSFLLREKAMSSASFEKVCTIDERIATSKLWEPDWGTIVILLAILQLLLSITLDR
jgi:hypothetical protein